MSALQILHRDPGSRARAGVLRVAHGEVRTPAFVPLATKGTVKGLEPREVAALGYDMVLGNTFHLFLEPGADLIAEFDGLHEFMGWRAPIITDSGGFQVFSMGHGTVADEIKGRAPTGPDRMGRVLEIDEQGVRFRSYIDGSERFMGPETSMEVQAKLGSDIALVFDECTPFNIDREYTARSTERTHRWLDRCLAWHDAHGPADQLVYGIVQGGVYEKLRIASTQEIAARPVGGIAIGGSLGAEKSQMYEVVGWSTAALGDDERPIHLLGIGDVDDLIRGVELGIDTFDCAMPTRLGRHGVALVPEPANRWRVDLTGARHRHSREPIMEGCPCPACSAGHSRGYLRYLLKNKELTGVRLLTLHNLAYLARLMAGLRNAIAAGGLPAHAAALRDGAAP
ncbi:MAG TPA: tRNA guanosine(34) transglycosylase Tgt [Solirubrobacteraceae bacterium]|nr:tRNA guanosine(34) transglycosylase Tgt [Solirubrobacteraceae bacterium]